MIQGTYAVPRSLTIVVNNYNYEKFVGEAVESALAQTRPAQVVVVDDGSTDGSAGVIRSFGDRIEAVFKPNGGQGSALNAGFANAKSDAVLFLDADDVLEPNAVATLLDGWRAGTVLAHYPMTLIDHAGNPHGVYPDPPSCLADGDVKGVLTATGSYARTVTSGMAFLRPALAHVMPMPERDFIYCADGYLLRSIAFYGPVQRFDACLARYRQHGANFSDLKATSGGLAAGFRKKIQYALGEFRVTKQMAETLGLAVAPNLGEQDADFLGYRLFSLVLEPERHPIAGDRRTDLFRRYATARWATPWQTHRRVFAIAAAAAATFGPMDTALTWIRWLHYSDSRPEWMRALAARRRRASLGGAARNPTA